MKAAFVKNNTVLIGDFNLDHKRRFDVSYQRRALFELFDEKLENLDLIQLINFDTWSRIVGLELKSSTLDHIYVDNVTLVKNVSFIDPCFGDHLMISVHLSTCTLPPKITFGRDWRKYTSEKLCESLAGVDWSTEADAVQEAWDDFEVKLITIIDFIVPLSEYRNGQLAVKPNFDKKEN